VEIHPRKFSESGLNNNVRNQKLEIIAQKRDETLSFVGENETKNDEIDYLRVLKPNKVIAVSL
jgi:hypothetical protein